MTTCGGKCGCAPCAARPSALELAADPAARKRGATSGQTIGRFGTFRADVDALKRDIHPAMLATDAAVTSCSAVTPGERTAWNEFFKSWKAFHDEETPLIVGVGRRYDEAVDFRTQLVGWQEALRGKCNVPGPPLTAELPADPVASAIKWVAIAAIVVGGAYVLSPLVIGARKLAK